jgi:hypothetical protein
MSLCRCSESPDSRWCLKDTIHLVAEQLAYFPSVRNTLGPSGLMGLHCLESSNNKLLFSHARQGRTRNWGFLPHCATLSNDVKDPSHCPLVLNSIENSLQSFTHRLMEWTIYPDRVLSLTDLVFLCAKSRRVSLPAANILVNPITSGQSEQFTSRLSPHSERQVE